MKVDKLHVAKNQVDEAIRLFFERRDPISVHTLACAAHQVLFDLSMEDHPSARFVSGLKGPYGAPPDLTKRWYALLNKAANFFKHADKDSSEELEFDPKHTSGFLLDCTFMIEQLGDEMSEECSVFREWHFLKYPDMLMPSPQKTRFTELAKYCYDPDDLESFRKEIDERKHLRGARKTTNA